MCASPYRKYLECHAIETEGRMVVARGWGRGERGAVKGDAPIFKTTSVLWIEGGDGCTTT